MIKDFEEIPSQDLLLSPYGIDKQKLIQIVSLYADKILAEDLEEIQEIGGTNGFLEKLQTDSSKGIQNSEEEKQQRIQNFDSNQRNMGQRQSFLALCLEALDDLTLIILLCAGAVSLGFGVGFDEHKEIGWIEGFAIMMAVFIVVIVTATNDYQKEKRFQQLQEQSMKKKEIAIVRSGEKLSVNPRQVLVGDLVILVQGMVFPADGIIIEADDMEVSEAALTGENDNIKKYNFETC